MRQHTLLLVFLTLITTSCFTYFAVSDCLRDRAVCFGTNGSHDAQMAPFKYRLLEPAITHLANPSGTQDGAVLAVIGLQGLLTAVTLPLLLVWLGRWMNSDRALMGVMIYCFVEIGAFHIWYLSLGTTIEVALIILSLLLIDRKWVWIAPVVIVASLNRETAVLIPALYLAWHWRKGVKPSLVLFAIYVGITAGLHVILGSAEHVNGSFLGMLTYNVGNILDAFLANLILSPLYWLVWRGYQGANPQLRRLMWVSVVYLVAVAGGGNWGEIMRYALPVLPLAIPVMLSSAVLQPHLSH